MGPGGTPENSPPVHWRVGVEKSVSAVGTTEPYTAPSEVPPALKHPGYFQPSLRGLGNASPRMSTERPISSRDFRGPDCD
jgi:hypothetical protein